MSMGARNAVAVAATASRPANGGDPTFDAARSWRAVLERDPTYDGSLFYAVRSTGIYCRPTCPGRRPRRENVSFFRAPAAAEQAGFRPCRRCHPREASTVDPAASLVRSACRCIDADPSRRLTLAELGARVGASPFHLQRSFKKVLGVTPRQYADARRMSGLKTRLRRGSLVTGALYDAGYGSSSRLYERAPGQLGMTPAAYRRGGRGMTIGYVVADCPLGRLLVAGTERGLCSVKLGDSDGELEADLAGEFPEAEIRRDPHGLRPWVEAILGQLVGSPLPADLPIDVQATAFQRRVWEALRAIPPGETRSYQEVARAIGRPTAARAVARACATNPVALVVPCHRVVRQGGAPGGYRWGVARKRSLLDLEARRRAKRLKAGVTAL